MLSVAPMMAVTDLYFRQMLRMLTRCTLLYTEMYPVDVVLEAASDPEALRRLLAFDPCEHPLAVQLGGRDPSRMAEAAKHCASLGYDEVNINVGCPSDTVSLRQRYGACLMKEASLVQQLAAAVRKAVPPTVAVTVKHRLGVDEVDSWEELVSFVQAVAAPPASVRHFVVHARKAILGLSTAENRAVPPLRPDWVDRLASQFPTLSFELNGALRTLDDVEAALWPTGCREGGRRIAGCMIGRAAYEQTWELADADRRIFGRAALERAIVRRAWPRQAARAMPERPAKRALRPAAGARTLPSRDATWRGSTPPTPSAFGRSALANSRRRRRRRWSGTASACFPTRCAVKPPRRRRARRLDTARSPQGPRPPASTDSCTHRAAQLKARLQAPLRELRGRLYQPLLGLFAPLPEGAEYRKRLVRSEEKHVGIVKAVEAALRAVPLDVVDDADAVDVAR